MLMTNEEAKVKLCPHFGVAAALVVLPALAELAKLPDGDSRDAALARLGGNDLEGRCQGDACAMWRWKDRTDPNWVPPKHHACAPPAIPTKVRSAYGYCGLAGKPEVA